MARKRWAQRADAPPGESTAHAATAGALASGVLLSLCFPPVDATWLAFVALAPLALSLTCRRMTVRLAAAVYLGGLLFHLIGLDWIRTCYGSTEMNSPYAVAWLVAGQVGALLFLATIGCGRLLLRSARIPMTVVLPVLWVAGEYLRHHLLGLLDHTGTPWLRLSLTQADVLPLAQLADIGGEYALTAVVAMVNGAVFDAVVCLRWSRREAGRAAAVVAAAAALVAAIGYGFGRMEQTAYEPGPNVCLMSERDLPPLIDPQRIARASERCMTPCRFDTAGDPPRPDILLWSELALHHRILSVGRGDASATLPELPEDLRPLVGDDVDAYARSVSTGLAACAERLGTHLVIGCERLAPAGHRFHRFNALAHVDPHDGYQDCYDKRNLVPWTEFVPWRLASMTIDGRPKYDAGASPRVLSLRVGCPERIVTCGCAICYDVAFPGHFRQMRREAGGRAPDVLIHCGSEGQDATGTLATTMLRMARLRAIENRRPVVRNTAHGFSGLFDAAGRTVCVIDRGGLSEPLGLGHVPLDRRESLYGRWGDWLPCLAVSLLGLVGTVRCGQAISRRRRRSARDAWSD